MTRLALAVDFTLAAKYRSPDAPERSAGALSLRFGC
jgi:hypothetical protein